MKKKSRKKKSKLNKFFKSPLFWIVFIALIIVILAYGCSVQEDDSLQVEEEVNLSQNTIWNLEVTDCTVTRFGDPSPLWYFDDLCVNVEFLGLDDDEYFSRYGFIVVVYDTPVGFFRKMDERLPGESIGRYNDVVVEFENFILDDEELNDWFYRSGSVKDVAFSRVDYLGLDDLEIELFFNRHEEAYDGNVTIFIISSYPAEYSYRIPANIVFYERIDVLSGDFSD